MNKSILLLALLSLTLSLMQCSRKSVGPSTVPTVVEAADPAGAKASTGFSLGGSYDFDAHNHLLFSAGTGLQNATQTNLGSWYLGWEITY